MRPTCMSATPENKLMLLMSQKSVTFEFAERQKTSNIRSHFTIRREYVFH